MKNERFSCRPWYEANYNINPPEKLIVVFNMFMSPTAFDPLHCNTLPFSLVVAVNVMVDSISNSIAPCTVMGLEILVRLATKSKSVQFTLSTSLHLTLVPLGVVVRNRIASLLGMNGSKIQSRARPCVTLQVNVTISLGHNGPLLNRSTV